jgi:hypothetical protein
VRKDSSAASQVAPARFAERLSPPALGMKQDSPGTGLLPGIISPAASETLLVIFLVLAGMLVVGLGFVDELTFWAHHGQWRSLRTRRPRL